jgi:hypothetical protein
MMTNKTRAGCNGHWMLAKMMKKNDDTAVVREAASCV